ncbi:S-protein homolog 24-like [Coffea eugenioides]|uniref:S-protein homolog 24-like n=1 Tax=Coffea eugenioides TaxID=49369 RepID=UPI000F60D547|nr:S-protein homolog 24-like [Coffea eugenioides]
MNHTIFRSLCFLLFLATFSFQAGKVVGFFGRYYLYVHNGLPDDSTPLTVHCASGNDDIGYHNLTVNQDLTWSFHMNFFRNTLYFCHFWRGAKSAMFDVYNDTWAYYCGHYHQSDKYCYWLVKENGFYFTGQQHHNVPGPFDNHPAIGWS